MTHDDEYKMPELIGSDGSVIMDFGDCTTFYPTEGEPPKPADAALIAAAPELLEACKNALSYMEVYNQVSPTLSEYEKNIANSLRSLIAKAEGNVPTQTETKWRAFVWFAIS